MELNIYYVKLKNWATEEYGHSTYNTYVVIADSDFEVKELIIQQSNGTLTSLTEMSIDIIGISCSEEKGVILKGFK